MNLNKLPLVLEDIILSYKADLDHRHKFNESLKIIDDIQHDVYYNFEYMYENFIQVNITYDNNNRRWRFIFNMCYICGEYFIKRFTCACYKNFKHVVYSLNITPYKIALENRLREST